MGILSLIALVLGCASLGFTLVACVALARAIAGERRMEPDHPTGSFSLLLPCERLTPEIERALTHGVPFAREVLVAAPGTARDVREGCERAAAHGIAARFVQDEPDEGVNRKVSHLRAALAHATSDVIVQADDDAVLPRELLAELLARLAEHPRNGAAFAPAFVRAGTPWGRHAAESVMADSPQSFVVAAAMTRMAGGAAPMIGTVVALKREALSAMGGYDAVLRSIGDDLETAARLHRAGYRVASTLRAVATSEPHLDLAGFAAQLVRWVRVGLSHRPALALAYPTLVAPLAVLPLLALASGDARAWTLVLAVYIARVLLALLARRAMRVGASAAVLFHVVLGDVLVMRAYVLALARRTVEWRGRTYALTRGGAIVRPGAGAR